MSCIKYNGVVSAFPGVGKSFIHKNAAKYNAISIPFGKTIEYDYVVIQSYHGKVVLDSDSANFDKRFFPNNYINHIEPISKLCNEFVILVSSHDNVRREMRNRKIEYTLVYPDRSLKREYIERYKKRGSPQAFIDLMEAKWDDFIDDCENDPSDKLVLRSGEYLKDVLVRNSQIKRRFLRLKEFLASIFLKGM